MLLLVTCYLLLVSYANMAKTLKHRPMGALETTSYRFEAIQPKKDPLEYTCADGQRFSVRIVVSMLSLIAAIAIGIAAHSIAIAYA